MAAIPRVIISHKMLTHHLIPTATLEILETAGGVFSQTKPDIKLAFSFFWGGGRRSNKLCVLLWILWLDTTGDKLCKSQLHNIRCPDESYIVCAMHKTKR